MSINIIIILDYYSTQHDMTLDCVVLVSLLSCLLFIGRMDSSHDGSCLWMHRVSQTAP